MSDERFNLTNMFNVYKQAGEETKTIIFEVQIGKGRFLVMSFFADDDESTKDLVFLYLRNINELLKIKLYGNHEKGNFYIYLNQSLKNKIIQELKLKEGRGTFVFENFMEQFNNSIPHNNSAESKVNLMREHKDIVNKTGAIDEADKIYLLSIKKVSKGTPQYKTLRKLYMYTKNNPKDIELLIEILKKANYTTAWGINKPKNNVNILEWINKLS